MGSLALRDRDHRIVLRGDLDFFHRDALLARLEPATTWGCVTVDLSDVRLVDAAALGCFARLHNAMCRINPDSLIRFVGVRPKIAWLFRLTRLDSLFELVEISAFSASTKRQSCRVRERGSRSRHGRPAPLSRTARSSKAAELAPASIVTWGPRGVKDC